MLIVSLFVLKKKRQDGWTDRAQIFYDNLCVRYSVPVCD